MPKFFVRQNQVDDGKIVINGQDVKMLIKKLRDGRRYLKLQLSNVVEI